LKIILNFRNTKTLLFFAGNLYYECCICYSHGNIGMTFTMLNRMCSVYLL